LSSAECSIEWNIAANWIRPRPLVVSLRDLVAVSGCQFDEPGSDSAFHFLSGACSERCGVGCHCGPNELLECGLVYSLTLVDVDSAPNVPFKTGIEKALWVAQCCSSKERQFNYLFVHFTRTDATIVGPDGNSRASGLDPFPFLCNVGVRFEDECAHVGKGLTSPVLKLFNSFRDICWRCVSVWPNRGHRFSDHRSVVE
jgi:hypothetical protein